MLKHLAFIYCQVQVWECGQNFTHKDYHELKMLIFCTNNIRDKIEAFLIALFIIMCFNWKFETDGRQAGNKQRGKQNDLILT